MKFDTTTVRYGVGDGKTRIQEIRIGGTKTKLVFSMQADERSGRVLHSKMRGPCSDR